MLVEVVKAFKLRGQHLNAGTVLDISEDSFEQLGERIAPLGIAVAEREYFRSLRRWWEIDNDPAATTEEARRLLSRLDELYRLLGERGREVPARLPPECVPPKTILPSLD